MCIECGSASATTCGCVGLFDIQLFGSEACFSEGGARCETAGIKIPHKQSKTQHDHLQRNKKKKKGRRTGGKEDGREGGRDKSIMNHT